MQPTHLFCVTSHEPFVPVHAVVFVAVHSTQPPLTHAGSAALGHDVGLGFVDV